MSAPKVYLAGPDVFFPDARQRSVWLKMLCSLRGLEGLFPLDADLQGAAASEIYVSNINLISHADAVLANISPFRGPHMDPGTAWEIGYATTLNKPVFAWTSSPDLLFNRIWCEEDPEGVWRDERGHLVENFDLAENLMIGYSVRGVWQSPELAIEALAKVIRPG